jgi:hypothetical protein
MRANFQRIIELFTQSTVTMLSKIWVWDPGSRGQKATGSRIRIRNTGSEPCLYFFPLSLELYTSGTEVPAPGIWKSAKNILQNTKSL